MDELLNHMVVYARKYFAMQVYTQCWFSKFHNVFMMVANVEFMFHEQ